MAVSSTGAAGYERTSSLPSITSFTMAGWVYPTADVFGGIFFLGTEGGNRYGLEYDDAANVLNVVNSSENAPGSTAISLNTWYHVALTCSGTGAGQLLGYLNGVLEITGNGNTVTAAIMHLMNTFETALTGRMAAAKVWSAALTADELKREMRQYVPIRRSNLNSFYPFLSTATDQDDFGPSQLALTVNGSPANAEGPPIPWKIARRRVPGLTEVVAAVHPSPPSTQLPRPMRRKAREGFKDWINPTTWWRERFA